MYYKCWGIELESVVRWNSIGTFEPEAKSELVTEWLKFFSGIKCWSMVLPSIFHTRCKVELVRASPTRCSAVTPSDGRGRSSWNLLYFNHKDSHF